MHPLETSGWYVIAGAIDSGTALDLAMRVRNAVYGAPTYHGGGIAFRQGAINFLPALEDLVCNPRILEVVRGFLGEQVRVSFTTGIVTQPGSAQGMWHADWPFNQMHAGRLPAPYPSIRAQTTVIWMLTPFTEDNGTRVLPGSQRRRNNPTGMAERTRFRSYAGELTVTGSPGDALALDSRIWHCPAANQGSTERVAVAVRYAPWWLDLSILRDGSLTRDMMVERTGIPENLVPLIPRDVFTRFGREARDLLGHMREE
jgi:hypothetical protein